MTGQTVAISVAILIGLLAGASPGQAQERRFFTVAAIEPKGGANVARETFPAGPLPSGGGYVIREPDETGRWEVSTYVWTPAQIVVSEGDEVTLDFVGINGADHATEIAGLDVSFTLRRGEVVRVEFTADRPGVYPVICHTHVPSMRGEIVVLPKS